jgi:hypothetical protein
MKSCVEDPIQSQSPALPCSSRPQPNSVLCVGDQHLPAAIIGERGGTIHIVVQGSPQFWVDDDGTLKVPDVEVPVRVFNIVRVEADEDNSAGDIPLFRVGLERLAQVASTEDPEELNKPKVEPTNPDPPTTGERKPRTSLFTVLTLLVVAIVLVGAGVVCQIHFGNWSSEFGLTGPKKSTGNETGAQNAEQAESAAKSTKSKWASELLAMPGAVPFAEPEVAKKLELTPIQMDSIRQLNKITVDAANDLEKYWGSGDRWELAHKRTMLLDESRRQALQMLTAPQRKLWEEITQ